MSGHQLYVLQRLQRGCIADRFRGEIGGLLRDRAIEIAAEPRANLVERPFRQLDFLVRNVVFVACLVDVDVGRKLALRERG